MTYLIPLALLALLACGDDGSSSPVDAALVPDSAGEDIACMELFDGVSFESVDLLDCGDAADCRWTIHFEFAAFSWTFAGTEQSARHLCHGGYVRSLQMPAVYGMYDPTTGSLTWNGVTYQRVD